MLWQVDVPHACYGIVTMGGVVTETAPIGRWLLGKSVEQARAWAKSKGGRLAACDSGKHRPSPPG